LHWFIYGYGRDYIAAQRNRSLATSRATVLELGNKTIPLGWKFKKKSILKKSPKM
jgi:hypothetical protein